MEESWRSGVDGTSHKHQTLGEDISCKAEDGMSVNTRMLKVDAGGAVRANNDLKLRNSQLLEKSPDRTHFVIPSIRARSDLDTILELIGSAKEVVA